MDCYITWASEKMELSEEKLDDQRLCQQLKEIWKESFKDSEEYIEFFLKNRFVPQQTVIAISNNKVVGATYLLPAEIDMGYGSIPVLFGYALGSLKEYRGQGISKHILDFIFQYCDANHYVFTFYPANEKLVAYYESIGLTKVGNIKKFHFINNHKVMVEKVFLADIASEEYAKLRNNFFAGVGYLKWDDAAINYAILENCFCGGFCKKLIYKSNEYILIGRIEDNKLIITEANIPDHLLTDLMQALAIHFEVDEVIAFLPAGSDVESMVIPWVMGYKAQILQNGYCNLLLN
ncbi:MAG: GNAT family N-acetyltransferase [Herbinix sp.]|nr:GNAT family N-acetyltransferase [Herbinix sp.]